MASFTAALKQWVIDTYQTKMGADDNYVTDAEKAALHSHANKTALDAVSGTNTGDQDLSGYSLTTHTHAASQISDSTATGRALITAATATAARTAISAAPALGNDDNYVTDAEKAALHTHPAVIAQGATAADARTAIGAGTSNLTIGTTAGTAKEGNYAPPNASTTVAGIVELATTAEATTGTDTTRATTPAGVKAALDAKAASDVSTYAALAHKAQHSTGGADALAPADIGAAPAAHTHDDRYYTEAEVATLLAAKAPKVELYLPGVTGNTVTTPDSAALSITGDMDVRVAANLTNWSPGTPVALAGKGDTSANFSWVLITTGVIRFLWSPTGAYADVKTATSAAHGIVNGSTAWVRAALDVDDGAGGSTVTFYKSPDGATWTQIGSPVVVAGTSSVGDTTAPLALGASYPYVAQPGTWVGAKILNGIGGTEVASWDGTWPHTRQRDDHGNVWTVNGTASAWEKDALVSLSATTYRLVEDPDYPGLYLIELV